MSERARSTEIVRLRSDVDASTQTSITFRIGFVAKGGNVVGTCIKFLLPDSKMALVHMDTETTAELMRALTELHTDARTVPDSSTIDAVAPSLALSQTEIGSVTVATVVRRFTVSNDDEYVTIRFELRNKRCVDIRLTRAGANIWLAQMDRYIAEWVSILDARGSIH